MYSSSLTNDGRLVYPGLVYSYDVHILNSVLAIHYMHRSSLPSRRKSPCMPNVVDQTDQWEIEAHVIDFTRTTRILATR